jgi:hypothetical protein
LHSEADDGDPSAMDKRLKDIGERGLLDALLPLLGRHTQGLPLAPATTSP